MKFHLIKLCFLCVLLVSCNTSKEIVYFQDIVVNQPEAIIGARDITVQPKDQISIMVSSKDRNWRPCLILHGYNTVPDLPICVPEVTVVKYPVIRWMIRETLIFLLSGHCILPV